MESGRKIKPPHWITPWTLLTIVTIIIKLLSKDTCQLGDREPGLSFMKTIL